MGETPRNRWKYGDFAINRDRIAGRAGFAVEPDSRDAEHGFEARPVANGGGGQDVAHGGALKILGGGSGRLPGLGEVPDARHVGEPSQWTAAGTPVPE